MEQIVRDGYYARWRGDEFEASPDGTDVRLYRADPAEGFVEVLPGRYARTVPAGETDLYYVRTRCHWNNEPFIILGQHEDWLRLEYAGGMAPVAARLGLEEYDFGVYQAWALARDVRDIQEQRI